MTADPHILATWVKGWTIARETTPPVAAHGGLRVDVGWPEQKARCVFPALSPAIGELASTIDEPWIFLKACTTADALQPLLPARWMIQRPGFLMVCLRPMFSESALPEGYTLDVATGTIRLRGCWRRTGSSRQWGTWSSWMALRSTTGSRPTLSTVGVASRGS